MQKFHRVFGFFLILSMVIVSLHPAEGTLFPAKITLYDHVVTFPKGASVFSIPFPLEKNTIYSIALESYVPYAAFELDIYLRSPEHTFQMWSDSETLDPITNPIYRMFVQFGIATTTNYTFQFFMITSELLNLHVLICRETTLEAYYSLVELEPIDNETAVMDITTYNSASPTRQYNVQIMNDTEMWMNFFQVSPVSEKVTNAPEITVILQFGNLTYTLIPGITYDGYGLPSSKGVADISSHYFRIRFASSSSGMGRITISQTRISGNAVNFAFIWFHSSPIGDGPDPYTPPPANHTDTNQTTTNTTNTTTPPSWTTNPPPSSLNDRIDTFLNSSLGNISGYFTDHFYLLFGICAGMIGLVYVVRVYWIHKRPKFVKPKDERICMG